jgi:hypothetical protein
MNRIQAIRYIEQASEKEELGEASNRFKIDVTDLRWRLTAQNSLMNINK